MRIEEDENHEIKAKKARIKADKLRLKAEKAELKVLEGRSRGKEGQGTDARACKAVRRRRTICK